MNSVSNAWHSYPKLYTIGHGAIQSIFDDEVIIEEKIDGSQFSFGVFDGELRCRSKSVQQHLDNPDKMFNLAIATAKRLFEAGLLSEGYMYSGEYLNKPKHNALVYGRTPAQHIIIFDIRTGHETYMNYDEKKAEAERIGLECVPLVGRCKIETAEQLLEMLKRSSCLGGMIEGLVVKNYSRFTKDGHAMIGKFVTEAFKEVHKRDWKETNPGSKDFLALICDEYRTKARWFKARQHLKEAGELEGTPKDIGKLVAEIQKDIKAECEDEIKAKLFKWAWPHIERTCIQGSPQWYKELLVTESFEQIHKDHG